MTGAVARAFFIGGLKLDPLRSRSPPTARRRSRSTTARAVSRDQAASAPATGPRTAVEPAAVTIITTPVSLRVQHSASIQETRYLLSLEQGKLIGQRCPVCRKVYIPPRGACPVDGVPTEEEVELT
ncbi:MAG: hypothetical protein JWP39_2913, partial [Jatrophihabitans sp.]|nr:hypothetical protein [Jatrophihabitans sp.]